MVGHGNEHVFPTFLKAVLNTKSNKSDSKVSSLWSNLSDELCNTFETLSDRINAQLSSHCNKKGSNQVMAESPSVSGLAQTCRTGWELHGCDTFFEHICGSFVMSQQCGKALSQWLAKIGDLIVGGQPPPLMMLVHTEHADHHQMLMCLPGVQEIERNSDVSPVCCLKTMHVNAGTPK